MITQNVTLINQCTGKYRKWNKIFNPGLALITLSGTRAWAINLLRVLGGLTSGGT